MAPDTECQDSTTVDVLMVAPFDGLESWTCPIELVESQFIAVAETILEDVESQEFLATI
ncbi:MAG: hypothetical protein L6305_07505 [Actinomycetia bacterium]|nr:hypothetical protein [Actinomycetes bacterium]